MLKFSSFLANGHIMLNTPVLVRSLKLSNIEPSQYLDGCPPGNTGCCWLQHFLAKFPIFVFVLDFSNIVNNLVDRYIWKDLVMFSRCKYKYAVYQQGLWAVNATGRFIKAKNESKSEA